MTECTCSKHGDYTLCAYHAPRVADAERRAEQGLPPRKERK